MVYTERRACGILAPSITQGPAAFGVDMGMAQIRKLKAPKKTGRIKLKAAKKAAKKAAAKRKSRKK